jgi:hypothetical protein
MTKRCGLGCGNLSLRFRMKPNRNRNESLPENLARNVMSRKARPSKAFRRARKERGKRQFLGISETEPEAESHWLDPDSPEARRLSEQFDPQTLEPIRLAELRKRLASLPGNRTQKFPQLLPDETPAAKPMR